MKKLPLLTAAAMATGVAMLAPSEAKACENCADMNGSAMCKSEDPRYGTFGACTVHATYDECGQETGTYCDVWYDSNCAGYGPGWDGPMNFDDYGCWYSGWGCGS